MRTLVTCWLFTSLVWAQAPAGSDVTHGVLLERDPELAGEFSVRAPDFRVTRYRFDAKTSVDRQQQNVDLRVLRPGDQVEVTSDQIGDEPLRYARIVHVTVAVPPPPAAKRQPSANRIRPYTVQEERLLPKGDLSFSGVIVRLDGSRLVLRTRTAGEQTIVLRQDTRYLENGSLAALGSLKPTMHVFVRGSKNLYGDVEGYQVAWGDILEIR
jgi:hypothetical protein